MTPFQPIACPADLWLFHYPALDCLSIADVVVGGAGYNTVAECEALGVPLVAIAQPRLYDRQGLRLQRYGYAVAGADSECEADSGCEAIATVRLLLNQRSERTQSSRRAYCNGATQAVAILERHLPQK